MQSEPTPQVILPSFLAGPAVTVFFAFVRWSDAFTDPILISGEQVSAALLSLAFASVIGVGPALLANAIGAFLLIKLGNIFPLLRFPLVWATVGAAVAWLAADSLEIGPDWTFAYTAAGAFSAFLCRIRLA